MAVKDVEAAGKANGFTLHQLRHAKRAAGVAAEKLGFRGGWGWRFYAVTCAKMTADEPTKVPKMTHTDAGVIYGENSPVSP